jgi:hypothetical protein
MGLIARALGREYRTTLANPSSELTDALGGSPTASGVRIGGLDGGLYVTTVYQCVDVLARTLASLPLPVYRRLERGKEKAPDHHLYSVLGYEPNPEMTSYDLRSTLQGHLGLTGNAYAEIERDKGDRVTALWPLNPRKMEVTRGPNGALRYLYELPDRVGRDRVVFNPSQIQQRRGRLLSDHTGPRGVGHGACHRALRRLAVRQQRTAVRRAQNAWTIEPGRQRRDAGSVGTDL